MDDVKITKCPPDIRIAAWSQWQASSKTHRVLEPVANLTEQKNQAKQSFRFDRTEQQKKDANDALWGGRPTYKQKRTCARYGIKIKPHETRREVQTKLLHYKFSYKPYRMAVLRNAYKRLKTGGLATPTHNNQLPVDEIT